MCMLCVTETDRQTDRQTGIQTDRKKGTYNVRAGSVLVTWRRCTIFFFPCLRFPKGLPC